VTATIYSINSAQFAALPLQFVDDIYFSNNFTEYF